MALVTREIIVDSQEHIAPATIHVLKEFANVFPKELPDGLPPMCDIQYAIDLVTGSSLPSCLTTE